MSRITQALPTMPAPAHIQSATLNRFIEGWKKWTPDSMMAVWSDDFKQRALPFSLGFPSRSRDQVLLTLPTLMKILTNFELNVHHIVHDAPRSKAVIYASSRADTPFGDDYKWTNEYAVFICFTDDGQQICSIEEMVDTAFFQDFLPKFQKYRGDQEVPGENASK